MNTRMTNKIAIINDAYGRMLKDILSPPIYGIWNYLNLCGFVTLIEAISPQFRHTVQIIGDPLEKKLSTGCKAA